MKSLVIYHDNCADGFGAAFAAWLKLGDDAEYLPMSYGTDFADPVGNREVYILDFSFPRETMNRLFNTAQRVVWLDHHKTAFEAYGFPVGQFSEETEDRSVVLDNDRSGALIAWEYFHPKVPAFKLIQHIDDRDRWQFRMEGTKEISEALWARRPWSFEQWVSLNPQTLINEGTVLLTAKNAAIAGLLKNALSVRVPVGQQYVNGLACNSPSHISEIGNELAKKSGTFGLVWYLGADGKVKLSFRSIGEYDVSSIAKALGGGGHRNAAGAETTLVELIRWLP